MALTYPLDFRPPMMYYTSIPSGQERPPQNRRWDAAKLRDLRKRLDANVVSPQEVEEVAHDMMDGEIVDLASDWLGNTVREIEQIITPATMLMRKYRSFKSSSKNASLLPGFPCWNIWPPILLLSVFTRMAPGLPKKSSNV